MGACSVPSDSGLCNGPRKLLVLEYRLVCKRHHCEPKHGCHGRSHVKMRHPLQCAIAPYPHQALTAM